MTSPKQSSVAIIGVSALFPGMSDGEIGAGKFWREIFHKRNLIADVPPHRWRLEDYFDKDPSKLGKTYSDKGAFLSKTPFDPMRYGVPPKVIAATDTSQLLALIVAHQVLEDAALGGVGGINESNRDKMSVILGVTAGQELMNEMAASLERPVWQKSLREMGLPEDAVQEACDRIAAHYTNWEESTFPGLLGNVVAGRIANRFNLGGTNCVTDAACASALSAVHLAVNELLLGESDVVITGGVDTFNDIFMYVCFSRTPALSPTGDCRPFSDAADGTILGEGLALFALKRTVDAIRDNDPIYATIEGVGTSSDGRSKSIYAPVPDGQAKAIRRAYERAGYPFSSIGLVEAHGTGTKAGDLAEFQGLTKAYADENSLEGTSEPNAFAKDKIALGSVKSQIGHTKAAAGAAGLFKVVMAIANRTLPATLKIDVPNPRLDIEKTPFYLNTYTRPWISNRPRRAGVSSFGFGGSNFHVTVQEAPKSSAAKRFHSWEIHLFIFTGSSPAEIESKLNEAAKDTDSDSALYTLARQTHSTYSSAAPYRLAFTATLETFPERIRQSYQIIKAYPSASFSHPAGLYWGVSLGEEVSVPKLAYLFPGQGSQYLNMGADLALSFDPAADIWDTYATELWEDGVEHRRLADVVFPIPTFETPEGREEYARNEKRLRATEWAQPALGVVSLAAMSLLSKIGVTPDAYAGHSFGEVMALCAAGVISPQDAIDVARCRGVLMANAAKNASAPGGMTAVKADSSRVSTLLERLQETEFKGNVVIANENGPLQTVVSGTLDALDYAEKLFRDEGFTFKRLDVATAFHSFIVAKSAEPFGKFLKSKHFVSPEGDVWSNVTASPYPLKATPDELTSQLAEAVVQPVRFATMIEGMIDSGIEVFLEVGSQGVLTRLVEQIVSGRPDAAKIAAISIDSKGSDGVERFFASLAKLVQAGIPFDLSKLDEAYKEESLGDLGGDDTRKGLEVEIAGGNYKKPYPPEDPNEIPPPNAQPRYQKVSANDHLTARAVSAPEQFTTNIPMEDPKGPLYAEYGEDVYQEVSYSDPTMADQKNNNNNCLDPAWFNAFQEGQRQLAAAHSAYQEAMAQSHIAFLKAVESTQLSLMTMMSGSAPPAVASPQPLSSAPPFVAQPPSYQSVASVASPESASSSWAPQEDTYISPSPQTTTQEYHRQTPPAPASWMSDVAPVDYFAKSNDAVSVEEAPLFQRENVAPEVTSPEASDAKDASSLEQVLLETVADKTGYPAEMLDMGMKLEADLGIDSIKRVEILSSVTDAYPNLPEVDTGRMAELTTLGEILDYLSEGEKKKVAPRVTSAPVTVDLLRAPLSDSSEDSGGFTVVEEKPQEPKEFQVSQGDGDPSRVRRWVVREVEVPLEECLEATGLSFVHLVPDGFGFSDHVVEALRSKGIRVEVVPKGVDLPSDVETVVYLKSAQTFYDLDEAVRINDDLFLAAKRVASSMRERGGRFITVQNTGGHFGFNHKISEFQAASSGAPALLKTAKREWPRVHVKAIDIDLPEDADLHQEIAERIAEEICRECDDRSIEVGLDAHGRYLFETVEEPQSLEDVNSLEDDALLELGQEDVILASGGARGVTAECLLELARRTGAKVILLGRTALEEESPRVSAATTDAEIKKAIILDAKEAGRAIKPNEVGEEARRIHSNREIRSNLQRVRDCQIEVRYLSVDVRSVKSISEALAALPSEWQRVTVLVHGAGVLADKRIEEKTLSQFDRVFATKINGFYALLAALDLSQLKAVIAFSSAAARSGNQGQSDYAMANEVLNKIAESLAYRYPEMQVKSLGWGPWRGGMVNDSLEHFFESRGVELIELADGAAAFANEVLRRSKEVEVCFGEVDFSRSDEVEESSHYEPKETFIQLVKECSLERYTWLEDHSVMGDAILPIVAAMEWMIEAGTEIFNGVEIPAWRFDRLSVLQGVRIATGEERALVIQGDCSDVSGGITAEMIDAKSASIHYRASLHPVERVVTLGIPRPGRREEWRKTIYDGEALFHEGVFQALSAVYNVREQSIFGHLRDLDYAKERIGDKGPRLISIDACLQLILLWIKANMNGIALPMSIEMATLTNDPWPTEGLSISATIEHRGTNYARASAEVNDAEGNSLAVLRGIQSYIY